MKCVSYKNDLLWLGKHYSSSACGFRSRIAAFIHLHDLSVKTQDYYLTPLDRGDFSLREEITSILRCEMKGSVFLIWCNWIDDFITGQCIYMLGCLMSPTHDLLQLQEVVLSFYLINDSSESFPLYMVGLY
jgi:hypothetical protein